MSAGYTDQVYHIVVKCNATWPNVPRHSQEERYMAKYSPYGNVVRSKSHNHVAYISARPTAIWYCGQV